MPRGRRGLLFFSLGLRKQRLRDATGGGGGGAQPRSLPRAFPLERGFEGAMPFIARVLT